MKKLVHSYLKKKGYKITRVDDSPKRIVGVYHEKSIETEFKDIINSFDQKGYPIDRDVPSYTMYTATKYVIENGIDGDFIECGVGDGNKLAIASAFKASGLSESLGMGLSALSTLPTFAVLLIVCACVTFLTETTSNTATTALLMPILAAGAIGAGLDPKLLMVPAAMSASCAFMLPVATAPNVIMFSTRRFTSGQMIKEGLALNFIGIFVIGSMCYLFFG